jgi:hypothetical protein
MVRVLCLDQPTRQLALRVIIDIGETSNTGRSRNAIESLAFEPVPEQIAKRLRAIAITASLDQCIELFGEIVVDGNRDPLHLYALHATLPLFAR